LTLDSVGGRSLKPEQEEFPRLPSLYQSNWEVEQVGEDFIEFSFTLDEAALAAVGKSGGLKIRKRYTVARSGEPENGAHHVDLQVTIDNLGSEPQVVGYRLNGPTGLPLEGWWYSTKLHPHIGYGAGARDIVYKQAELGHELLGCPMIFSEARKLVEKNEPPLISLLKGDRPAPFVYAGVDTQFFASVILPQTPSDRPQPTRFRTAHALPVQDVAAIPKNEARTTNVSVRLATNAESIEPDSSLVHEYRVFFGPKDGEVLASYDLSELMEYGWPIFEHPAKLLQGILTFLHNRVVFNYGLAIILLTMLVRSCMVPISLKQARSAAKMQELAPEMAKIKQKHPDDPMKQHQAMQELYKKHNFNPFGGCLLVFIQLPIFIGLYRCLSVDIDLRDASLIPGLPWAANLAGPDKLFYWESWMPSFIAAEIGWLGPYFNILPIATVGLFLLQQKMFMPPPTDEQTRLQQQMMTYMMLFMAVLFYKVPAGLCVYFITSSLWGIAERKMLPKSKPKDSGDGGGGVPAVPEKKPASPNGHARPSGKKKRQRQR
jgi:YidC/Oxa1 family membrane protein insertase